MGCVIEIWEIEEKDGIFRLYFLVNIGIYLVKRF